MRGRSRRPLRGAGLLRAPVVLRSLAVAAVVALVALQPSGASAGFATKGAGTLAVGTATLPAPSTLSVVNTCPTVLTTGTVTVTFPNPPMATAYTVVVEVPLGQAITRTITSGPTGATIALPRNLFGTYTVSVTSALKSWTSAPASRSFTCLLIN